jgi:TolB-like protein
VHSPLSRSGCVALGLALSAAAGPLHAQCADGSPPPCVSRAAPAAPKAIDRNVVAVLPFHVTTTDTLLGEGFAELLTSEFTGESGAPRAIDMGSVLADWRRSGGGPRKPLPRERAVQLARNLGAGLVTEGSIVGLGRQLTITARLYEVPSGRPVGTGTRVQAHSDSLDSALRQTASNLLASYGAPLSADAGARFTSSPEAMRNYLNGLAEYRRGRLQPAATAFEQAIALDSTFAHAIFRRFWLQYWSIPVKVSEAQLWAVRENLSRRERAIVEVNFGSNFPQPQPTAVRVRGAEQLAATMSDSPEVLFFAGDEVYHYGALIDANDHLVRGRDYMLRAFRIDSQATTLRHLIEIGIQQRDSALLRQLIPLVLRGSDSNRHAYAWTAAALIGDTKTLDRLRRELSAENAGGNFWTLAAAPGFPHALMDELAELWYQRITNPDWRVVMQHLRVSVLTARGRLREAARVAGSDPGLRNFLDLTLIHLALTDAAPVVRADSLADLLLSRARPNRNDWALRQCWVALVHARRGDSTVAVPASLDPEAQGCARAVDLARLMHSANFTRAAVFRADSAYRATFDQNVRGFQPYLLAQAWEKLGDRGRALGAIRLRPTGFTIIPVAPWLLGEEGRLAAAAGDTTGAIRAYRDYLDYMAAADPIFDEPRARARAELTHLTRR